MFSEYVPSNYELVCFLLENGEKRFLPTYGRYGYLDLMDRLIDKWEHNDKITESIRKRFNFKKLHHIKSWLIKSSAPHVEATIFKSCGEICNLTRLLNG